MKSTGVVRKVDELGRIVLPIEIRRNLGIDLKDPVEIFVENNMIILKKYDSSCIFLKGSSVIHLLIFRLNWRTFFIFFKKSPCFCSLVIFIIFRCI